MFLLITLFPFFKKQFWHYLRFKYMSPISILTFDRVPIWKVWNVESLKIGPEVRLDRQPARPSCLISATPDHSCKLQQHHHHHQHDHDHHHHRLYIDHHHLHHHNNPSKLQGYRMFLVISRRSLGMLSVTFDKYSLECHNSATQRKCLILLECWENDEGNSLGLFKETFPFWYFEDWTDVEKCQPLKEISELFLPKND